MDSDDDEEEKSPVSPPADELPTNETTTEEGSGVDLLWLDEKTVRLVAQVTGKILDWSEQRKQEEVESILGRPSAPTRAHGTG